MKQLQRFPAYTFLLALFFCLHGAADNLGYITAAEVLHVFLWLTLAVVIFFLLILAMSRSLLYAGFIVFFISLQYFFFGPLKNFFWGIPFFKNYTAFLPLLFVVNLIVIIVCRKKDLFLRRACGFLNILLILYVLVDGVTILLHRAKAQTPYAQDIHFNPAAAKDKPDVYFLLFDEYAGYESLRDSMGFKNDLFYDQLRRDSFAIIPAFSNYSITPFSMSSIFNMDYLHSVRDSSDIGWRQTQERMREIKNARVFSVFTGIGYSIKTFSLFDVMNNRGMGGNEYLLGHERVLTNKMFHNVIMKDLGYHLLTGKHAVPALQRWALGDMLVYNEHIEDSLFAGLDHQAPGPVFTYCHFLMPHFPFLYDSAGMRLSLSAQFEGSPWLDKGRYVSYLKYCNSKILSYTKRIIQKDPGALVILLSDHGFRDFNLNMPASAFNNFCAIRCLSKTPDTSAISNVNLFRSLFNRYFDQQVPLLNDRRVFLREIP